MKIDNIDKNFAVAPASDGTSMKKYPAQSLSLYGVFYDSENARFTRMPDAVARSVSAGVTELAKQTSGGRVCFATDSTVLELEVHYPSLNRMGHMPLHGAGGFVLSERTDSGEKFLQGVGPGYNEESGYKRRFSLGDGGMREYVLYMPLYNAVSSLDLYFDLSSTVKRGKPYRDVKPILYYGSSITQGGCASRPDNSYQGFIHKRNNIDYINLGFSGNAKGEREMAEYLAGIDCSLFVCDYDYNAPSADHLKSTHYALYETFRSAHPDTPIIFASKPDPHRSADGAVRAKIVRSTCERAKNNGDKNVYFINGKSFYGEKCKYLAAVDGTHPTDLGFYLMAEKFYSVMCKIDKKFC